MSVCMCTSYHKYSIANNQKIAPSVNSNLNYSSKAITSRMETTHGPTSSNDNSDGGYCMTMKTARKFSEDSEIAFCLSTNDISNGD